MDYFLIAIIFALGTGFHVMQKVMILKTSFPKLSPATIWKTFFEQEWDSLLVSFLIFLVLEVALFVVSFNEVKLPAWLDNWGMYVLPLVIGYAGQRLAYKYLGTAEEFLQAKADKIKELKP